MAGAGSHDTEKQHRRLAEDYTLSTPEGVTMILRDLHVLRERRFYVADYAACDILYDLQIAINKAKLSQRQREALFYVYERDMTQTEAAERMGVGRSAVANLLNGTAHYDGALERIAAAYMAWGYDEESEEEEEEAQNDAI